ncbi:MAG TPA: hypothetical protein VEZ11_18785 [Thermoanaerobaculia bacterium]|nr:hypothetical protein [Thermoanaerobaculia bacterium]
MRCPYCTFDGPRRALHAHAADVHAAEVKTTQDPQSGKLFYELQCPFCPQSIRKQIKPRGKDPSFVEEYSREIRLVAFDVLLYHLEDAHNDDDQRLQHP